MGFIALYALALMGTSLLFLAPLLVTLALKINSLVGIEQAPSSWPGHRDRLAAGHGRESVLRQDERPHHLDAGYAAAVDDHRPGRRFGRHPHRRAGAQRPGVLVGWCIAQLMLNALLAALVAVLPDQVLTAQRGLVSGVLGICLPIASISGTFVVQLFTGNQLAMFLAPCAIGGFAVLLFVLT